MVKWKIGFGATCVYLVTALWLSSNFAFAAGSTVLKSAGCKTEYYLFQDLAKAYKNKTGTKLQLGSTGNKKALTLMMDQKIDFAFTCKTIDQLAGKLKLDPAVVANWKSVPVAKDPIVVVSNRENGVADITREQLVALFQGKIENWKELGGTDLAVRTAYMDPELESGVNLLFKEFTVGAKGKLDKDATLGKGPANLAHYVARTPGAVTFIGFNSYHDDDGDIISIDGVAPTKENILNGNYALTATYYLTFRENVNADVSEFINFIRSEDGTKAIGENFISYSE